LGGRHPERLETTTRSSLFDVTFEVLKRFLIHFTGLNPATGISECQAKVPCARMHIQNPQTAGRLNHRPELREHGFIHSRVSLIEEASTNAITGVTGEMPREIRVPAHHEPTGIILGPCPFDNAAIHDRLSQGLQSLPRDGSSPSPTARPRIQAKGPTVPNAVQPQGYFHNAIFQQGGHGCHGQHCLFQARVKSGT